jgi:serine/threonine-protein kinase RIO1
MPASPRLPTFPSGKLVMHTDSDDNDEPPPLMADSDSSSEMIKKSYLRAHHHIMIKKMRIFDRNGLIHRLDIKHNISHYQSHLTV